MKSTILSIMNPRVTELKPPIENQEFFIVDRYLVSIYQRREMKRDDLTQVVLPKFFFMTFDPSLEPVFQLQK